MSTLREFQCYVIKNADRNTGNADLPTYTELREALAEALRKLPAVDMAPLLPVLTRAGGEL